MFENFNDRARRAVVMAQEVARELNHRYIGPEHLLVALAELAMPAKPTESTKPVDSLARTILLAKGHTPDILRQQIEAGDMQPYDGHLVFTVDSKKTLKCARQESQRRQSTSVDDIDILLGILRPNDKTKAVAMLKKDTTVDAVENLRSAIAEKVQFVSVTPVMTPPDANLIRIFIPRNKVPEDGVELIEQINDNLVDYSVEDLQRILQFVKESRLRIASY